jgi:hypothetical protein
MAEAQLDLDYAVFLRENRGVYELRIRELLLIVRGPDLRAAYQELMRRKQVITDTVTACGTIDELPQPQYPPLCATHRRFFRALGGVDATTPTARSDWWSWLFGLRPLRSLDIGIGPNERAVHVNFRRAD